MSKLRHGNFPKLLLLHSNSLLWYAVFLVTVYFHAWSILNAVVLWHWNHLRCLSKIWAVNLHNQKKQVTFKECIYTLIKLTQVNPFHIAFYRIPFCYIGNHVVYLSCDCDKIIGKTGLLKKGLFWLRVHSSVPHGIDVPAARPWGSWMDWIQRQETEKSNKWQSLPHI